MTQIIEAWVYPLVAVSAAILAVWLTVRLSSANNWDDKRKVILRTWLFCIFLVITGLVSAEEVYEPLIGFTKINNINWLMSYLFMALVLYIISGGLYIILNVKTPRWMHIAIMLETSLLLVIFFAWIATGPLSTTHETALNLRELLFIEVAYLYMGTMCINIVAQEYQLIQSGRDFHTRVRWIVSLITPICAGLFFLSRFIYVPLIFFFPATEHDALHSIMRLAFVISSLTWPIFYFPNKLFEWVGKPFLGFQKLWTFYDLNYLQCEIDKVCPRIVVDRESWLKKLAKLDMNIYRALIGILDAKQVLGSYFSQERQEAELIFIGNSRLLESQLDSSKYQQMYQTLTTADDSAEYQILVKQYRTIARAYRKGRAV